MTYLKILMTILLLFQIQIGKTQQVFTLDDAISIALKHNHSLEIDRNDIKIAQNKATLGNAGLLPTLDANVKQSYSSLNTAIEFGGGLPSADEKGAASYSFSASLDLSYTIFDGFKNRYRLKSLNADVAIKDLYYTANVEKTMVDVINSYYNLIKIQSDLYNNMETYNYSVNRYEKIENELKYGQNNLLEQEKSKGYMNADTSRILNTQMMLNREIFNLNKIMGIDTLKGKEIFESAIILKSGLQKEVLKNDLTAHNIDLKIGRINLLTANLDVKTAKNYFFPKISLTSSYAYGKQANEVGTLLDNQTLGPTVGISIKRSIYKGGINKKDYQNTKIAYLNAKINVEETTFKLEQDFEQSWSEYQYYLNLIPLEKSNVEIAESRYEKSRNQNQLGQLSSLELRDAQLNLNKAKATFNEAMINAKLAEWELMRLIGGIMGK